MNSLSNKKRKLPDDVEADDRVIQLPLRLLNSENAVATQDAELVDAPTRFPMVMDGMEDLQLISWNQTANPGNNMASVEDIRYFRENSQYPWRPLSNDFLSLVELGIIKPGGCNRPTMHGRVQFGANGLFKRKFIFRRIKGDAWRSALGDLYPVAWDQNRLVVNVQFPDGRPMPETCVFVPANGPLYTQWLRDQVHHGRRKVYCLQVIYDERECYRKMSDKVNEESDTDQEV